MEWAEGTISEMAQHFPRAGKKKKRNCQLRILYPAKISFINEGKKKHHKTVSDEGKLRKSVIISPTIKECLKGSSLCRNDKRFQKYQERRKKKKHHKELNFISDDNKLFFSCILFSELGLTVDTKFVTLMYLFKKIFKFIFYF